MISRRILMLASLAGVLPKESNALAAPSTPVASGTPQPVPWNTLLEQSDLPDGMDIIQDGQRTLEDIVANFPDPAEAKRRFRAWGWEGNVVRAFHQPSSAKLNTGDIDGVYLSAHAFGSADTAEKAAAYIAGVHALGLAVEPVADDRFAVPAIAILAQQPYGQEITWYARVGRFVLRLSASAPKGDPQPQAQPLMATWLERNGAAG